MYIPRKSTATFVMAVLLVAIAFLTTSRYYIDSFVIIFLISSIIIAYTLINWVSNEKPVESKSRRKVEKLLRELDDDDLDLLRRRLVAEDRSDDYSSMNELIQSRKRKNEVR